MLSSMTNGGFGGSGSGMNALQVSPPTTDVVTYLPVIPLLTILGSYVYSRFFVPKLFKTFYFGVSLFKI